MYEMEGPRTVSLALAFRLLGRPELLDRPPFAKTRLIRRSPGSSRVPESPPARSPFPVTRRFVVVNPKQHKGFSNISGNFFCVHRMSPGNDGLSPVRPELSTGDPLRHPQGRGARARSIVSLSVIATEVQLGPTIGRNG